MQAASETETGCFEEIKATTTKHAKKKRKFEQSSKL
jgi:hypothetical protein